MGTLALGVVLVSGRHPGREEQAKLRIWRGRGLAFFLWLRPCEGSACANNGVLPQAAGVGLLEFCRVEDAFNMYKVLFHDHVSLPQTPSAHPSIVNIL